MAVLEILTAPDPRLRLQSKQVTDVASVQTLIDDLLDTLYATDNGIGLAAPQVGREEAIVVIDLSDNRDQPLVLINPKVVSGSNKEMGKKVAYRCQTTTRMWSVILLSWWKRWIVRVSHCASKRAISLPLSCNTKLTIFLAICLSTISHH